MKNRNIFKIVVGIVVGIMLLGLGTKIPGIVERNHANRRILPDSIATLNRIVTAQQRELWFIGHQLDSISKTGGELIFTSKENKVFSLKLTPKQ